MIPEELFKREGRKVLYHPKCVRIVIDTLLAEEQAKNRQPMVDEDGFPAGSGDDPATIRWRNIRADILELDLHRKRGQLVDVAVIEKYTSAFARIIRDAIGRITSRDDVVMMNEAIGEAERVMEGIEHADAA